MRQRARIRQADTRERSREGAIDIDAPTTNRYQSDLGFSTSNAQADVIRETLTDFDAGFNKAKKETSVDYLWNKAKKDFVTVGVYDNNNLEAEYRLPKSVVDGLQGEMFNKGDGSYVGAYHDGRFHTYVTPQGTDDKYGKELHEALQRFEKQTKDTFYTEAQEKLAPTQAALKGEKALRDDSIADRQEDYQRQLKRSKEEFGALKTEGY